MLQAIGPIWLLLSAALLLASPVQAQAELFDEEQEVFALSGFVQRFSVEDGSDDERSRTIGIEMAGALSPKVGTSLGIGQTTGPDGEITSSLSLGISYFGSRQSADSPATAEVGAGIGYVGASGASAFAVSARLKLAAALTPNAPFSLVPTVEASTTQFFSDGDADSAQAVSLGLGMAAFPTAGISLFARPGVSFVFAEEGTVRAFGITAGIAFVP